MSDEYLIKNTTKQQRIELIKQWIPEDDGFNDCDIDLWDMYADYINGTKEISECNAAFDACYELEESTEWKMDYDAASDYWKKKDAEAKKMRKPQLRKVVDEFIFAHNTCSLATGSEAFIRCTPIEYSYINGSLYMFSEGGLKFKGLKDNKNVCLAIFDSYEGFEKIGGMQIAGIAEIIEPFCEEYLSVMEHKHIPKAAFEKLDCPMNLIKVAPKEIDLLRSDLKEKGYNSRQHLSL